MRDYPSLFRAVWVQASPAGRSRGPCRKWAPLGLVSGTAMDAILARRLQRGNVGGHMHRALERFPIPGVAQHLLNRYFIPCGKPNDKPFRAKLVPSEKP